MYQIGDLECFKRDDPEIAEVADALKFAADKSDAEGHAIVGVWTSQEEGSELVAIAYEGRIFWAS